MGTDFLNVLLNGLAVLVIPTAGWLWKQSVEMRALELSLGVLTTRVESLDKSVTALESNEGMSNTSLGVIKSMVEDLRKMTPAIEQVARLTIKVEAVLEQVSHRVELLEDYLFKNKMHQKSV